MIFQRKLVVSACIGFLSMCDAACANSCFYVDATFRPTNAKGQYVRNKKEEFVI
jgi:hypothetical protein